LLFEALATTLVTHMTVAAAARMDLVSLRRICIDETAAKRGHDYITIFVDIDTRRVVIVTDGRDADTIRQFAEHVDAHNSDASRFKEVCIDMSGPFIKGVKENLTEATITFDKFHVMQLMGRAVDDTRRV
jgi:transposase